VNQKNAAIKPKAHRTRYVWSPANGYRMSNYAFFTLALKTLNSDKGCDTRPNYVDKNPRAFNSACIVLRVNRRFENQPAIKIADTYALHAILMRR